LIASYTILESDKKNLANLTEQIAYFLLIFLRQISTTLAKVETGSCHHVLKHSSKPLF